MDTKPKRFTVHGIFGKAFMETAKDVFKGKFDSSIKEKIAKRLDDDEDLQSFIADIVVQQIKNITEDRSALKSQLPVVKKILDKIYKNDEFQKLLVSKIDYANVKRKEILSKLQLKIKTKIIPVIERKYSDVLKSFLDEQLQKEIKHIKKTLFSIEEPNTKTEINEEQVTERNKNDNTAISKEQTNRDDKIAKFGKKKHSDKILNPSTGRYVKRNGKIGRQLLKGNVPKKIKKNSKETKRIKNKKNSKKSKKK